MPDINLLGDTKNQSAGTDDSKRKKIVPPAPVEMSSPLSFGDQDRPLKKPSSFGLWMRSMLGGRSKDKKRKVDTQVQVPAPRTVSTAPMSPSAKVNDPVDIFADLGKDVGGPKSKQVAQESPAPTGPRPGDFPPLPTMPAWKGSTAATLTAPSSPPSPAVQPPSVAPMYPARREFSVPPVASKTLASPPTPLRAGSPRGIPPASGLRIPSVSPAKQVRSAEDLGDAAMNLLPEDLITSFDPKKKTTTIVLVAVAAILVIGIAYVSLLLWKETVTRRASEKSDEATIVDAQIKDKSLQAEYDAAVRLRAANTTLSKLLDTHIYWTQFLGKFEKYTLSTVVYPNGVQATPTGQLALTGSAPDLATVIAQLEVYRKATDFIVSAEVKTVSRDVKTNHYSFVIDLVFNPLVLLNPVSVPAVLLNGVTSTNTSNTNSSL